MKTKNLLRTISLAGMAFPLCFLLILSFSMNTSAARYQGHTIDVTPPGEPTKTMYYRTQGNPDGQVLLMIHGWPTSSELYEDMMDQLCSDSRGPYYCIAPDHVGFGKSDCPASPRLYTPGAAKRYLKQFIIDKDLNDFVGVVHDWGGPIATAAFMEMPDRLSHLVVQNTFFTEDSGILSRLSGSLLGLWHANALISTVIGPAEVELAMQNGTSRWLGLFERREYSRHYSALTSEGRCKSTAGLQLFEQMTRDKTHEEIYDVIAENLPAWNGPATILYGQDDCILGPSSARCYFFIRGDDDNHDYIRFLLPQADVVPIQGAHHFMQEDKPYEISWAINSFLQANP